MYSRASSHPCTASVRCSALIRAVEDTCGLSLISVRSQPTGGLSAQRRSIPGLQVICCSASPGASAVKHPPLHWPQCAPHCMQYRSCNGWALSCGHFWRFKKTKHYPHPSYETRTVSLKEKARQLKSKNFVEDRPAQDISACCPGSERVMLYTCMSGLVMCRPGLMWPGVAPYSFMRLFPYSLHPPSRRHLFVAWENVEVKKEKTTFWL